MTFTFIHDSSFVLVDKMLNWRICIFKCLYQLLWGNSFLFLPRNFVLLPRNFVLLYRTVGSVYSNMNNIAINLYILEKLHKSPNAFSFFFLFFFWGGIFTLLRKKILLVFQKLQTKNPRVLTLFQSSLGRSTKLMKIHVYLLCTYRHLKSQLN